MSQGNGPLDPNAGLFVVQITYNPVNKRVEMQYKPDDQLIVLGMLELAKQALLRQQIAKSAGPQLVVPRPVEPA